MADWADLHLFKERRHTTTFEESNLTKSSLFTLLRGLWKEWDVPVMVLFSLTLQIVLSVLGRRRKFTIKPFSKKILLLAYLGADWIAIATLSKLSSKFISHRQTLGKYVEEIHLDVLWAPLLLLHLGGPDTITAYAFEDNKYWIKHLFILVVKAIFVIYFSWPTYLILFLNFAGISRCVGKILCLKLNNSLKTKLVIFNIFNPQRSPSLDCLLGENPNVLRGYLLFTITRPDVNDYLSAHNLVDVGTKIRTYQRETTSSEVDFMRKYVYASHDEDAFEVVAVALGFMFDVVYTKAALIYIELAWFLRITHIISSFTVLLLFVISFTNSQEVGIAIITCILLSGTIALEFYTAWVMLSSDWGILIAELHPSVLVRKMFKAILRRFPGLKLRRKRWSDRMGQFDLLKYCWHYKKRKVNQSSGILWKIIDSIEIIEMWNKYKCTKFENVPSYLKHVNTYADLLKFIVSEKSSRMSRGQKALQKMSQFDKLKWSIEFDFDHSIIVWHLATSVCFLQEDNDDNNEARICHLQEDHDNEAMKISKYVSDYMMYLLVMCPALLLSEHSRSFWLDNTYDNLKELMSPAIDMRNAVSTLVADCTDEDELESSERTFNTLQREVFTLATLLKQSENKWEMIKDVWIEMLVYAAVSSQHMSHLKQLGEGIEFLSLIWLLVGRTIIKSSVFEEEVTEEFEEL